MGQVNETTLEKVFTYHPATEAQLPKYHAVREAAKAFAGVLLDNCPECADRTVALRLVREAAMTANASIALDGLI